LVSIVFYAARTTKGIIGLSRAERALITLPDEIKEMLIGILLDDGQIVKRSPTANSRFTYTRTAVAHKEYF
jgi:hypothetical protein